MPDLIKIVREQAASTEQLLQQIKLRQSPSGYYDELLSFLLSLCKHVNDEVEKVSTIVQGGPRLPVEGEAAAKELKVVFYSHVLGEIHSHCESFDHAEQLTIPIPMMQFLNRLGKDIGYQKPFILRGMLLFNYMYHPIGRYLNALAASVSSTIELIDPHFATFSFPLANSQDLLVNCALVHEFGHLAVDTAGLINVINQNPQVVTKVTKIVREHASKKVSTELEIMTKINKINDVLISWTHEVLADLVGIELLGPAHLFSFIYLITPSGSHQRDDPEHPCDSYRLKLMINAIGKFGWEETMKEAPAAWEIAQSLSQLERERDLDFRFDAAAECLPILEPTLFEIASTFCSDAIYSPSTFELYKRQMFALLARGIPPSEMLDAGAKEFRQFDAASILNAGWLCYEKGFPGWDEQFSSLTAVERKQLLNRLLTKAIELSFVKEAESAIATGG